MSRWRHGYELNSDPEPPKPQRGRFTHVKWADTPEGSIVAGRWFQPMRSGVKNGKPYLLGEVEHANGLRTGFTVPQMLAQQLEGCPIGATVTIIYRGTQRTGSGHQMHRFDTHIEPPSASGE